MGTGLSTSKAFYRWGEPIRIGLELFDLTGQRPYLFFNNKESLPPGAILRGSWGKGEVPAPFGKFTKRNSALADDFLYGTKAIAE